MFKKSFGKSLFAVALSLSVMTGVAQAAGQIRIVGSSTVYPFSTTVAEQFGKTSAFRTPIVESTGSGGGLKLFCAGIGEKYPDIANTSRRIKKSEVERCAGNGVDGIIEVKIGYDGIVLANAREAQRLELSLRDIFLALAREVPVPDSSAGHERVLQPNPYQTWKDVNDALPDTKIEVLGPPPTSGTRDAFVELAMEGGCKTFDWIGAMKEKDKEAYQALCHTIREDGHYTEVGENDNLIVQKLGANPDALGIFGYSFLDQNADTMQGSTIDGNEPTFENIAGGAYPVSRPLFFYVKKAHIGRVAGLEEFMAEFTSEKAWGEEGYLSDKGLIPMAREERQNWHDQVKSLASLGL